MFYYIVCCQYLASRIVNLQKLPHHERVPIKTDALNLLVMMQESDSPMIGIVVKIFQNLTYIAPIHPRELYLHSPKVLFSKVHC